MSGIRKKHSKEKKLKVVLAALAGEKPVSQIASEHSVHPAQIKEWKSQALEAMGERFAQRRGRKGAAGKPPVDMMDNANALPTSPQAQQLQQPRIAKAA